jgi:addiction module HigA family antidote
MWIWKITIRRDDVMPMKNPVHPGALAKANLDELDLSVAVAAKTMKITRQQLHNVMQGRSALTPEMALRFEKAFGGSADMWLRMQAAYDLAKARKHQGEMNIPRLVAHPSL